MLTEGGFKHIFYGNISVSLCIFTSAQSMYPINLHSDSETY